MSPTHFPDDDTGDALRRLLSGGDNLTTARDIDFTVVFSNETAAREFARHFHESGHKMSITNSSSVEDQAWDVLVVNNMVPTYEAITEFEAVLQSVADPLGGLNDGWGCIAQNDPLVK